MRKKLVVLIIVVMLLNTMSAMLGNIVFASNEEKKNENSYWSTKNAPIIYGATKITIKKGMLKNFDVNDTRFRVFAKDFEDGDLTEQITHTGAVDINVAGEYKITYKVQDSHNNTTTLEVPIIVTEDGDSKIIVERTIYTIPSIWNLDMIGVRRCNYGDRQNLGIYLPEGTSVKARALDTDNDINVQYITNDANKEISQKISKNGEWITLQNTRDGVDYASVPLITSTVLSKENTDLTKTYKIELEYDETVKELNYYHYKDNEENFMEKWEQEKNEYALIENEVIQVVVPFADKDKMTNFFKNGFSTLDEYLEYYKKVVDRMDEFLGVSLNPKNLIDQNVRTKYLIRANAHGAGAAYYNGNHVGVNSTSVAAFFEMNWGGLHEIAHGYQGSLGNGEMQLGEVANNILGHYIQIDKSIYTYSGDWLGELSKIEENKNKPRLEGKTFNEQEVSTKLYMIVNLFDHFEGGQTYAKMFKWYREQVNSGRKLTNQDAYVEAMADIYNVNIIPYMESWKTDISEETKIKILERNLPMINILKDVTDEETLNKILLGENITEKYSLVSNEVLQKYNVTGNLKLTIKIDDIEKLKGKTIKILDGNNVVKTIEIDNEIINIENLPAGTYRLQMPVNYDYDQDYAYIQIKANQDNTYEYEYKNKQPKDYNNYLTLKLQGIYNTYGYELTFSDNYTKAMIKLNGANMGNNTNAYIKIYDENKNVISEEKTTDIYFDYNKEAYTIDLKPGDKVEVYHPNYANKVKIFSTLSGAEITQYVPTTATTIYEVIENGIIKKDTMSEEESKKIAYGILKEKLVDIIESYKNTATDEEIEDTTINFKKKAEVIDAYQNLKDEDKEQYKEFIERLNPEEKSEDKPEEKPDERPEEKPDERPEEKPDEKPDQNPDEKPDEKPDQNPDEKPDEKPDQNPDEKPDEKPDQNPDEKPAENPDQKPEEKPNEDQNRKPEDKTDENPVEDPEEKTEQKPDNKLEENESNVNKNQTEQLPITSLPKTGRNLVSEIVIGVAIVVLIIIGGVMWKKSR